MYIAKRLLLINKPMQSQPDFYSFFLAEYFKSEVIFKAK